METDLRAVRRWFQVPAGFAFSKELYWELSKVRGSLYFGVLIIRMLLFRVLYYVPLSSETPN